MPLFAEARTIISRSPARIAAFAESLRGPANASTLLFALSSNAWKPDIPASLASKASTSLGCLSAPLNQLEGMAALSVAFVRDGESSAFQWTEHVHDADDAADSWAASALGEAPKTTCGSGCASSFAFDTPVEDPSTILAFASGPAVNALPNDLLTRFPRASQIGLVASHTPFVTGQPFTLFHNGATMSAGAVGLAFAGTRRSSVSCSLDGFRVMTPPVAVTSARGNIVHMLGKDKATRFLLMAIHQAGMDSDTAVGKDDEFYLALLRRDVAPAADSATDQPPSLDPVTLDCVLQINSGDPSRGSIAVESNWGPRTGDYVQILHRSVSKPTRSALDIGATKQLSISNTTLELLHAGQGNVGSGEDIVMDGFLASSENGIILRRSFSAAPWTCNFPGISVHTDA